VVKVGRIGNRKNQGTFQFSEVNEDVEYRSRSLTPYQRDQRGDYNSKHKNDSQALNKILTEQEEHFYFKTKEERRRRNEHAAHNKSVDYAVLGFKRGLGNIKNEDQLEEVFAPVFLKGKEELMFRSVNQQSLSPEHIKRKNMTRYNRFKNMKNDSTLHDIMTYGS